MTTLEEILSRHAGSFASVVPFDAGKTKLLEMDFTEKNVELTEEILSDTNRFSKYVNNRLSMADATYGIGGYAEHRTIYSRSRLFDGREAEEPRRLHLGIDIWGKPHVAVMSPMEGIVHSFAMNDSPGDYGATIILTHILDGMSFYTLYGHLSLNSLKNMQEGNRIRKGEVFAEFGVPFENGQWPPHLHFQLIADMEGRKGDYPGVCKYSERERWLRNSPNPESVAFPNSTYSSGTKIY